MDEILRDLIKTTLEKGPQNKQFYSNLSITKPIHDQVEVHQKLGDAISFLRSKFSPGQGFQSKLYTSRNCAIECSRVWDRYKFPVNTVEVFTSAIALDLLFNNIDNEHFVASSYQEIICNFSDEIQEDLLSLIVPSSGISTFNLFKKLEQASPVSSPSPIYNNDIENVDSGNDSPTSMYSNTPNQDKVADMIDSFPDDINTSMISLYALMHQGILQPKPVESVLGWIISNVFSVENHTLNGEVTSSLEAPATNGLTVPESVTFPVFITRQGNSDAVGVANFLNLMYLLDVSHEVLLNAAEEFLVTTLKDTLSTFDAEVAINASIPLLQQEKTTPSESHNSLGNTQTAISSTDNEEKHQSSKNEDEAAQYEQQSHTAFILQHHSPDSLLYFLSRALAISSATNNGCSNSTANSRRPNISQMKSLLLRLLDARLGTTMNTCDLAMRILAGVYLGVVNVSNNTTNLSNSGSFSNDKRHLHQDEIFQQQRHNDERYCFSSPSWDIAKLLRINNLLQKEFELLASLQNNVDGSWQADSILQLGFCEDKNEECVIYSNDCSFNDNTEMGSSSNGIESVGYLGGKELATLFAVKAISVFLSSKKGNVDCDETVRWHDLDNANKDQADVELHQLY